MGSVCQRFLGQERPSPNSRGTPGSFLTPLTAPAVLPENVATNSAYLWGLCQGRAMCVGCAGRKPMVTWSRSNEAQTQFRVAQGWLAQCPAQQKAGEGFP